MTESKGRRGERMNARWWSLAVLLIAGCASATGRLIERADGRVIMTGGPNQSMIYVLQTTAGLILIDLGWWGARDALHTALLGLDSDSTDVVAVLLTHAHRDHIAAWPAVAHATFHVGAAETDELFGEAGYDGWIPRTASQVVPPQRPARGALDVVALSTDTTLVIGADSVHVFLVPGHTDGSVAYLVRRVLFAGDALAQDILGRFRPARSGYSDDVALARISLASLFERIAGFDVELICTAHARCSAFNEEFIRQVLP